jgi:hypothetical protein
LVKEGEHSGKLRFAVAESPFTSKNILVELSDVSHFVSIGESFYDPNCENNYLKAEKYTCEATGEQKSYGLFLVSKDSWRDSHFMDWISERKDADSETNALYNDLLV